MDESIGRADQDRPDDAAALLTTGPLTHPSLRPGRDLPPFARPAGLASWNRFAAVNDEFVDFHMDDGAGRRVGYPGAIGMGNLLWSYLHQAVEAELRAGDRICSAQLRFEQPALRDSTVIVAVRVEDIAERGGAHVAELAVRVSDDRGRRLAVGGVRVCLGAGGLPRGDA